MAGGLYYEHTCSLDTDLCTVTHLRVLSEKFVHSLFFLGSFVLWEDDLCNRDLYYHRYVRTLDTTFGSKTSNIKQKNAMPSRCFKLTKSPKHLNTKGSKDEEEQEEQETKVSNLGKITFG